MPNEGKSVSLSPKFMVDSVADWSLLQVIAHLKKKENDGEAPDDSRVYSRSSIKLLDTVIEQVATDCGLSRGMMCRCLSYHGAAIMEADTKILALSNLYKKLRRLAVTQNNPDIADIINGAAPYSPKEVDDNKTSYRVYSAWTLSTWEETSQACGVFLGQLAQIAMLQSLLTYDTPELAKVMNRFGAEKSRWDLWMQFRLSNLELAVAQWESLDLGAVSPRPQGCPQAEEGAPSV